MKSTVSRLGKVLEVTDFIERMQGIDAFPQLIFVPDGRWLSMMKGRKEVEPEKVDRAPEKVSEASIVGNRHTVENIGQQRSCERDAEKPNPRTMTARKPYRPN